MTYGEHPRDMGEQRYLRCGNAVVKSVLQLGCGALILTSSLLVASAETGVGRAAGSGIAQHAVLNGESEVENWCCFCYRTGEVGTPTELCAALAALLPGPGMVRYLHCM